MAGKSKLHTTKTAKSASRKRGLLTEEDRSLWQRVVDSLELDRTKKNIPSTNHDAAPIANSDEIYKKPQTKKSRLQNQKSNNYESAKSQHARTRAKDTAESQPHSLKSNLASKNDDLNLWDQFKSSLDHQKPKQDISIRKKITPQTSPVYPSSSPNPSPTVNLAPPRPSPSTLQHHPLEDRIAKKLAKKQLSVDARIDLHGMTQDQAHRALEIFLINAQKDALSIVLVITGKGNQGQGILRQIVPHWLHSDPFAQMTNGFRHANAHHGGTGALYVRIRKQRRGR